MISNCLNHADEGWGILIFSRFEPMKLRLLSLIIGWIAGLNGFSQGNSFTLVLIDRPSIKADSVVAGTEFFRYRKSGRKRMRKIKRDQLFAIQHSNGIEQVVYQPDSLELRWYSVDEMRFYLQGQEDAFKGYKVRANRTAVLGFLAGAVASYTGLYGTVIVAAFPILTGSLKPAFNPRLGFNPQMANNPFYKEGYGTMAKHISGRRVLWAVLSGYAAGTLALTLLLR